MNINSVVLITAAFFLFTNPDFSLSQDKRRYEEEARRQQQEQARRAQEAQRQAQLEAQRRAQQESQRRAQQEHQRQLQEQQRRAQEDSYLRQQEQQRRAQEEAWRKQQDEVRRRAEEDQRRAQQLEAERQRRAQEELQRRAEQDRHRRFQDEQRRAQEERNRLAQQETARKQKEEQKRTQQAQFQNQRQTSVEARRREDQERLRQTQEKKSLQELAVRRQQEEQRKAQVAQQTRLTEQQRQKQLPLTLRTDSKQKPDIVQNQVAAKQVSQQPRSTPTAVRNEGIQGVRKDPSLGTPTPVGATAKLVKPAPTDKSATIKSSTTPAVTNAPTGRPSPTITRGGSLSAISAGSTQSQTGVPPLPTAKQVTTGAVFRSTVSGSSGPLPTHTARTTPTTIGVPAATGLSYGSTPVPTGRVPISTPVNKSGRPVSGEQLAEMQQKLQRMKTMLASDPPPSPRDTSSVVSRFLPGGRSIKDQQKVWEDGLEFQKSARASIDRAEQALKGGDIEGYQKHLQRAQARARMASDNYIHAANENLQMVDKQIRQTKFVQESAFIACDLGDKFARSGICHKAKVAGQIIEKSGEHGFDPLSLQSYTTTRSLVSIGKGTLDVARTEAEGVILDKALRPLSLSELEGARVKRIDTLLNNSPERILHAATDIAVENVKDVTVEFADELGLKALERVRK